MSPTGAPLVVGAEITYELSNVQTPCMMRSTPRAGPTGSYVPKLWNIGYNWIYPLTRFLKGKKETLPLYALVAVGHGQPEGRSLRV